MIENALYYLLASSTAVYSAVGGRLYPTTPSREAQLPFGVYQITGADPVIGLGGPSGLAKYTLVIDAYAINEDTVLNILATFKSTLAGYSGGSIQGIFPGGYSSQEEEYGYHGQQTYTVWAVA